MNQMPEPPITLQVPPALNFQFVYRTERNQALPLESRPDLQFCWLDRPTDALRVGRELQRLLGWIGFGKVCLKLLLATRRFYIVVRQARIVHHGWVTFGKCKHYWIEPTAVVIGPIWTAAEVRGQRIGTYALQCALNRLIARGVYLFYIDTAKLNYPCQKLIEHCTFGPPVGLLPREPED